MEMSLRGAVDDGYIAAPKQSPRAVREIASPPKRRMSTSALAMTRKCLNAVALGDALRGQNG